MGSGQKNFQEQDRKSLQCLKKIAHRNMDVNDSINEDSEGLKQFNEQNLNHHRKYLSNHNQTVKRNVDVKGTDGRA